MEIGRGDVARAMVSRLAIAVDCELACLDEVEPDGKTLITEELDTSFGLFVGTLGDKSVKPYLQTTFTEGAAQVSPTILTATGYCASTSAG